MATPVYSGNSRRAGRAASGRYRPMSEINVTPLVDVMLVLLVVFMVTAPLLTVGVPVELPQTQAPPINEPKEPLTITLNREGAVFIQETSVPVESLTAKLQAITGGNPDSIIYVRGDKEINYGRVLEVMSLVSAAGFRKVSLVAEAPKIGAVVRPAAVRPAGPVKR
ncbi:MAG TPA: protein TolR [Stellaceae bacterium]|jgi:biopolymer transport protein TolR|nr:protein TolR [Stellaceae bacterium]